MKFFLKPRGASHALTEQVQPQWTDFDHMVRDHQAVVMGLARSLGLRGADADDAAAEVFADILQALPGFRGDARLSTWVYRIAWRTIVKQRTQVKKRRAVASLSDESSVVIAIPLSAADSETSQALWSAVEKLEPMQAAAVELYYRRQWSVTEVADVLQCPPNTVKTMLHRARATLRIILSACEVMP